MSRIAKTALSVLGLFVASLLPSPVSAQVVTLEEVLNLASNSMLVTIADAEIERAEWREREAGALRFPRIRVQSTLSPAPRVELDDPNDPLSNRQSDRELLESLIGGAGLSFRAELRVTVPLTTFGQIRLARRLAAAGAELVEVQREAAIDQSRFEAYRAYVGLQVFEVVEDLFSEASGRLARAEELLEDQIDDGDFSARTSLRQLTISRASFTQRRTETEASGRLARFALLRLLQLPVDFETTPLVEDVTLGEPPSLDDVIAAAIEQRPDLIALRQGVDARRLAALVRWRALAPTAGLTVQMGGAYSPTVDDVSGPFIYDPWNRFGLGFGVGLSWNMNPLQITRRARRADAEVAIIEAQLEGAVQAVSLDIAEAYWDSTGKLEAFHAQSEAYSAARAWLNQRWFQFDQGLADFDDVKDPLEAYYRVAGEYYAALTELRMAVANLALQCGDDDFASWPTVP
ncbi:MAG: outer membrane protein TolC [Bradymonadia bacterium]|jgi:outer membrane protein TolC